jgi:hypothetical protein
VAERHSFARFQNARNLIEHAFRAAHKHTKLRSRRFSGKKSAKVAQKTRQSKEAGKTSSPKRNHPCFLHRVGSRLSIAATSTNACFGGTPARQFVKQAALMNQVACNLLDLRAVPEFSEGFT